MEKEELIQKVLQVYKEGMRVKEIEEVFKISVSRVYQIIRIYGTPELTEQRKKVMTYGRAKKDISKEQVIAELKTGLSYEKAAKKLGVSPTIIRNRVKEYEKTYGVSLNEILEQNNVPIRNEKKQELPIEEIIQRWKNGESIADMAKEYNTSESKIYRLKKERENMQQETQQFPNYKKSISMDEIISDIKNKMIMSEIAKKYNIALSSLKQRMKDYERVTGTKIKDILAKENVFFKTSRREDITTEQIVEDWKNGSTLNEIAQKYNMSEQTVFERKKAYEVEKGEKIKRLIDNRISVTTEQIIEEWKNGSTIKEIAQKHNISMSTVFERKKEYQEKTGIKIEQKNKPIVSNKSEKNNNKVVKQSQASEYKISQKTKQCKTKKTPKIRIGQVWKEYANGATLTELASRNNVSIEVMRYQLKNYQTLLFTKAYVDGNKTIKEIARESGCDILDVKERIKMVLRKEIPTVNIIKYLTYRQQGHTEESILKIMLLEKRKQEKQAKKLQKQNQTKNGDEQR